MSRVANQLRVPRIIDGELWTQAHPSGVAFLAPDDGPPGLGIVFDDPAAGVAIFEDWLSELGAEDRDELIRVAIVEGDVAGQPGYSVVIEVDVDSISDALAGSDLEGVDVEADGLGSVRWRMPTPPGGSPELAAWKQRFAAAGRYALVPVIDDGDGLDPAYEMQLVKRKLAFESPADEVASDPESAMTITLARLARWSEQLCTLPPLDLTQTMLALGIPGAVAWRTASYALVEPAPPGTSRLALVLEHLGANAGHLGSLQVVPSAPITRAALDRELGPGEEEPPVADGPEVVAYDVQIRGAAFTCSVSALFDGEPAADAAVREIRLRRDPVIPAVSTADEVRR